MVIGRLVSRIVPVVRDILALAGAALVAYGAWLIYAPAGFIAGGVLLLAATILSAGSDR